MTALTEEYPRGVRLAGLLGLVLALVVPAPAGAAPERPERFMERVLRLTVEGRHGQAWALLHPAHQRFAPRAAFVACRVGDPSIAPYRLVSARLVSKRSTSLSVPGVRQRTATQMVIRFRIADDTGSETAADARVHAVWTGARWAWILPAAEIPAFRAGHCPGAASPVSS